MCNVHTLFLFHWTIWRNSVVINIIIQFSYRKSNFLTNHFSSLRFHRWFLLKHLHLKMIECNLLKFIFLILLKNYLFFIFYTGIPGDSHRFNSQTWTTEIGRPHLVTFITNVNKPRCQANFFESRWPKLFFMVENSASHLEFVLQNPKIKFRISFSFLFTNKFQTDYPFFELLKIDYKLFLSV